jgi:hypothetical protein
MRFLPHAVGNWLSSLRDFLANTEFTLETVSTNTVYLRRVHDRIVMDDVLAGSYTNSEIQAIKDASYTSKSNASQIYALLTASV